jgi:hypothetical protein
LARSTLWPRRLNEGSANAAAERKEMGLLTHLAHSAVCNADAHVGAVRQPGGALCCSAAIRAWATPACLVGSRRLPPSIIAPAGTNGCALHLHSSPTGRHATAVGIAARTLSVAVCRCPHTRRAGSRRRAFGEHQVCQIDSFRRLKRCSRRPAVGTRTLEQIVSLTAPSTC